MNVRVRMNNVWILGQSKSRDIGIVSWIITSQGQREFMSEGFVLGSDLKQAAIDDRYPVS